MAVKIADIFAALGLDDSAYNSKMDAAEKKAGTFSQSVTGFLEQAGRRAFDALVAGAERAIQAMGDAVQASSNLNEEINKSGVVFGDSAAAVVKWSETTTEKMGVSQRAALQATGQFGLLFRQIGQSSTEAASHGEELVQVAADIASIYNITVAQAIDKINSGLVGMSRPLRDVGIFLTEQNVAQKAVTLGLAASTDAVSESAKVEARRILILEQSKITAGDQARTVLDLAGAYRKLTSEAEDGAAKLGNVFRPAVTAITNELVSIAPQMFGYATNIMDQFASGIAAGIRALLPAIMLVRQLFTYYLAPGSPPRILPDIDKWGAAAMGQFLSGFSSVDVKNAFDTVGSAIEGILRSSVAAGNSSQTSLVSSIFGTQDAIRKAVAEFASAGSVSEATINRITRAAGDAGPGIANLVKAYFNLQTATTAATRAQDELNSITERYDAILNPLQGKLDDVRAQQQHLADQQRLIAAQNVLTNFDSTAAEKRAAQLEIEQITLEDQISTVEQKKKSETDAAQAQLDGAKKQEDAAQKQLDIAQATIDQQVQHNNLIGEQRQLEKQLADQQKAAAEQQARMAEQLHQAQLQYTLGIENTQQKITTLKGELANTTQGSVEYYSILGQISSLEKQAADDAQRDKDKVTSAQLDYNLSLADTAGKIAIWQGELAKATPGTAEYFNILTKIHDLNVSLAKEGAKGAAGDIGGSLSLPNLSTLPKLEPTPGGKNLADAINELVKAGSSPEIKSIPPNLQKIADSLGSIGKVFGVLSATIGPFFGGLSSGFSGLNTDATGVQGTLAKIAGFFTEHKDTLIHIMTALGQTIGLLWNTILSELYNVLKIFISPFLGDWKGMWDGLVGVLAAPFKLMYNLWSVLLGFFPQSIQDKATALWTAGGSIVTNILNGIKAVWPTLLEVWRALWTFFTDFLPGSEPKNADSPLSGLGARGIALVTNILNGLKEGWITLSTWWKGILPELTTDITGIGKAMYDGGSNLIGQFWDGLKAKWGELSSWFTTSLAGLRAQLPFSEPKDPSSPLRGLAKSGESMVNMIQGGINAASISISPLASALLPSTATTNNHSSTANNMTFNINIGGGVAAGDVRNGAKNGVLDALRAAGLA